MQAFCAGKETLTSTRPMSAIGRKRSFTYEVDLTCLRTRSVEPKLNSYRSSAQAYSSCANPVPFILHSFATFALKGTRRAGIEKKVLKGILRVLR